MVKTLCKFLISVWIVYHVYAMLIMPNLGSYLGRLTSRWVTPYANTIGLNASWNFFSPDPAHTMYIAYTVYFDDNDVAAEGSADSEDNHNQDAVMLQEPISGYIPQEQNQRVLNPLHRRDMYAMRFFAIDSKRFRTLLGPWICRQHKGASTVEMEHIIETVPPLDQMSFSIVESVREYSQELKYSKTRLNCQATADEEIL